MTDFATERDMCAAFIGAVQRRKEKDWTVYPETGGFDILLVREHDGFQIGIEAKLRLNSKVVAQSLPSRWSWEAPGPDCRAVLVPKRKLNTDLKDICEYIGITIITIGEKPVRYFGFPNPEAEKEILYSIHPDLPRSDRGEYLFNNWYEWAPDVRLSLPEVVPDCDAGCPSPLTLTPWKIKAIKIVALLETTGYVTRKDFKDLGINPQLWTNGNNWLIAFGKQGAHTTYITGPNIPDFRTQHPRNFEEIAGTIETWMPKNRKEPA